MKDQVSNEPFDFFAHIATPRAQNTAFARSLAPEPPEGGTPNVQLEPFHWLAIHMNLIANVIGWSAIAPACA
jgi:hypothetical protein